MGKKIYVNGGILVNKHVVPGTACYYFDVAIPNHCGVEN